jgi:hypothetical protein
METSSSAFSLSDFPCPPGSQAGPELDRRVALEVLGSRAAAGVPPFSTDLRAAIGLANELGAAMDWSVSASSSGAVWTVTCRREGPAGDSEVVSRAAAPTRPLAICRALLALHAAEDEPTAGARRSPQEVDRRPRPGAPVVRITPSSSVNPPATRSRARSSEPSRSR